MPRIRVDFTVEPFREGQLGPHVEAALDVLRGEGFAVDVGPFGNAAEGDAATLLATVGRALTASFDAGAGAVSLSAGVVPEPEDAGADEFLAALRPVAGALGGRLVAPARMSAGAVPLVWRGEVVGGLERPEPGDFRNGLAPLVAQIEQELGGPLAGLSRVDKQRAVRLLDERGGFALRNAVDEVADTMGVSRVTVYNYLNATRAASG